jgi:hypothetical protein
MVRSSNTTLFAENEAPQEVTPYTSFLTDAFTGRIAMVMGAKNMTMTEVQHGRRIGECSPAKLGSANQF